MHVFALGMTRASLLILALAVAGCAARPGPEVLAPASGEGGKKLVTILAATTRATDPSGPARFAVGRPGKLRYARYVISIPPGHVSAAIEWPKAAPDARTDFVTVRADLLSEQQFKRALSDRARSFGKRVDAGVFVHGYNTSFQEALFRQAQIASDASVGVVAVLFSWPSAASPIAYGDDKRSAGASRGALAHVLSQVAAERRVRGVIVFGHSMGGWLTMEAMRDLRATGRTATISKFSQVVLAAPDIAPKDFVGQINAIGRLPSLTVLVTKDDVALRLSGLLEGGGARVGAADIDDPLIQEASRRAGVRIIDISNLNVETELNHGRYAGVAALYPALRARLEGNSSQREAGAFSLNAEGSAYSPIANR